MQRSSRTCQLRGHNTFHNQLGGHTWPGTMLLWQSVYQYLVNATAYCYAGDLKLEKKSVLDQIYSGPTVSTGPALHFCAILFTFFRVKNFYIRATHKKDAPYPNSADSLSRSYRDCRPIQWTVHWLAILQKGTLFTMRVTKKSIAAQTL